MLKEMSCYQYPQSLPGSGGRLDLGCSEGPSSVRVTGCFPGNLPLLVRFQLYQLNSDYLDPLSHTGALCGPIGSLTVPLWEKPVGAQDKGGLPKKGNGISKNCSGP